MALTRAQLLMGNDSQGAVLPGEVQGVKQGSGILIATDGTISVDSTSVVGLVKLNNAGAFNGYVWPSVSGTTGQVLTKGTGNTLLWSNGGVYVSATAPLNPEIGDLWFDCTAGQLLVYEACTSGTPKWSGSGAGLPVLPGNSSASPAFASGSGTLLSPYVTSATTASSGSAVTVLNVVTVNGLAPFQFVPIVDLNAYVNGGRFSFTNNVANASGVLTFEIVFTDSPVSPNATSYTANIKVGNSSIYINAGVSIVDSFFIISPGTITGSPLIGSTLTYTPGTYNGGAPPVTTSWKWYENTTGTLLQTGGTTYLTTSNEFGDTIFVVFTATDVNGTFTSAPTTQFGPIDRPPFPGPTPPTIPIDSNGTSSSTWASGSTTLRSSNCLQFNKNGGTFGQGPTSVINGDIITTRWNPSSLCANAPDGTFIDGCLFDTNFSSCGSLTIDRIPTAVTFTAATNVTPGAVATSNTVTPTGFNTPCFVSYNPSSTGSNWQASINGAAFVNVPLPGVDTVSLNPGNTLAVRFTTGSSATTTYNFVVDLGAASVGISNTFAATTGTAGFPNLSPSLAAGPTTIPGTASGTWADGSTTLNSTGCLQISTDNISFGTGPLVVTNSSTLYEKWSTSGICGGAANGTPLSGTLTNGTTTNSYNFTIDRFPAPFTFTPNSNVNLSTVSTSNTVTLSGTNTSAYVTYGASSTGTSIQGSVDGGTNWSNIPATGGTSFVINPGQTLTVRLTTGASISTGYTAVITVGDASSGTSATFTATTAAVPDFPNIAPALAAGPSTIPGTASGTWADGTTSLTSTGCIEFQVGAGSFNQGPTSVNNGDVVTVQYVTSSGCSGAASGTTITGTLTNGANTNGYSLTLDRNPNTFTIASQTGQALSSTATSGSVTLSGTNSAAYITYTVGALNTLTNVKVSINSGAYVTVPTSGTTVSAPVGATLQFRGDVGASASTAYTITVNVGTTTATWSVTTTSAVTPTITQPSITSPGNNVSDLNPALNSPAGITLTGSTYTGTNSPGAHTNSDWLVLDMGADTQPVQTSAITSLGTDPNFTSQIVDANPSFPSPFTGTGGWLAPNGGTTVSVWTPATPLSVTSSVVFTTNNNANSLSDALVLNGSYSVPSIVQGGVSSQTYTVPAAAIGGSLSSVRLKTSNSANNFLLISSITVDGVRLADGATVLNLTDNTNLSAMTIGDTLAYFDGPLVSASTYQVSRSLRFDATNSTYLNRTFGGGGNRRKWTWSAWVKRSDLGRRQYLFSEDAASTSAIQFTSANNLSIVTNSTTSLTTTAAYTNVSEWINIVVAFDTAQATDTNRIKLYVNGTQVTDFSTTSYPALNEQGGVNRATLHNLGVSTSADDFGGYLTQVEFVNDVAEPASAFGETVSATGQWVPKAYSGVYGTTGFYLNFSDNSAATAAALGKDYSGNNNNWTPNNFSVLTGGPTSVADATGALPVLNTTGTYGTVASGGVRTDANSAFISLALPMNGTNGGTTFGDQSAAIKGSGSAKSITNSNAETSTASSKFYGSSGSFSGRAVGADDYLSTPNSSDFQFGSGDFTVELWVNVTQSSPTGALFAITAANLLNNFSFSISESGGNIQTAYSFNGSSLAFTNNTPISLNAWNHVAVCRNGSIINYYLNGIKYSSSTVGTASLFTNTTDPVWIGGSGTTSGFTGYLNDVRVYKGVAKYTSNFAPPSSTVIQAAAASNDSFVDSPTYFGTNTGAGGQVRGNYPTWNPLIPTSGTVSNGNLQMVGTNSSWRNTKATTSVSTGKWYFEATYTGIQYGSAIGNLSVGVGFAKTNVTTPNVDVTNSSLYESILAFTQNGYVNNFNAPTSVRSQIANGDVVGFALNYDAGTYTIYVNDVSTSTGILNFTGELTPWTYTYYSNSYFILNTGQRPFAYTAPTGYQPLVQQLVPPFGTITGKGTSSLTLNPSYGTWVVGQRGGDITASSVANTLVGLRSTNTITAGGGTSTLTIAGANTDGFAIGNPVCNGLTGGSAASGIISSVNATTVVLTNVTGTWVNGQTLFRGVSAIVAANSDTVNLVSYFISQVLMAPSHRYSEQVRYKSATTTSAWSGFSSFDTASVFAPVLGSAVSGGFFGGQINDGGIIYNLIVAPKATGQYNPSGTNPATIQYKTTSSADTPATTFQNEVYGFPATHLGNDSNHPAFQFASNLPVGGYDDWYLPAKNELEILYYNLKTDTTSYNTSSGQNPNAVPARSSNYTAGNPAQTSVALFQTGGAQAFTTGVDYQSSTEGSTLTGNGWGEAFLTGYQSLNPKGSGYYARAIRREYANAPVAIGDPFGGGFFAGQYVDGGITYNLIVAPKATGQYNPAGTNPTGILYKTSNSADSPAVTFQNEVYGKPANDAGNDSAHPAFQFARGLTLSTFSDWYIPAKDELAILFNNLGPSFTTASDFQTGNTEAFATNLNYWSSTEFSSGTTRAWVQIFSNGLQDSNGKFDNLYARAVRRVAA